MFVILKKTKKSLTTYIQLNLPQIAGLSGNISVNPPCLAQQNSRNGLNKTLPCSPRAFPQVAETFQ